MLDYNTIFFVECQDRSGFLFHFVNFAQTQVIFYSRLTIKSIPCTATGRGHGNCGAHPYPTHRKRSAVVEIRWIRPAERCPWHPGAHNGSSGCSRCRNRRSRRHRGCGIGALGKGKIFFGFAWHSIPPFKFMVKKKRATFSDHSLWNLFLCFAASFSFIRQTPFSSVGCLPRFSWYAP